MENTPPKPKKKRYVCKYLNSWEKEAEFQGWLTKSVKGDDHAFCRLCMKNIKIDHGGKNDLMKHVSSATHQSSKKSQNVTVPIQHFLTTSSDEGVVKAEFLFSNFIAEHNIPFAVADHFTKLCKSMFSDSQIARKFACGRTKTTMIVKNALAPQLHKEVVQNCRTKPFSLACDESNDRNSEKTLAILVRYFDNQAVTRFLDMPICNVGTSQNIFDHLEQVFINNNIPWENLIAFSSDNCNVMMGKKNSVMTKIKEMQPHVFDIGCICHLANLCTMAGVKSLSLPVDDLLVDVYYHFHHSALRKETYKEYLDFCDVDPSKLLKHCSTRWLSLEKCVKRLLHHWPALTSYFNSHSDVEKPGRVKRVAELLRSHEMRMTFHFLGYVLEPLNEFNTTFQADESRIGYLGEEIHKLLRKFLGRFIKAGIIKNSTDLISVDFQNPENQLQDNILAVGILTRSYIAENDEDIPPVDLANFFQNVRRFYCAITKKMLKNFPFKDPVVNNLGFLNPHRREETTLQSIVEIARRFPAIVQEKDFPKLEEEFLDFSVSPDCDLPNFEKGRQE